MREPAKKLRTVMAAVLGIAGMAMASHTVSADRFRQLKPVQIKALIAGKAVTDDAHWSDHFYADGSLKSIDLGETKRGAWKLQGDTLCLTRQGKKGKTETECNEIWASGNHIEYRRDGATIADGVIKEQW